MTTSTVAPAPVRSPLTERILQLASDKGLYQYQVRQLAGISLPTWRRRLRSGRWTYDEVCDIATALDERVDVVLTVTDTL